MAGMLCVDPSINYAGWAFWHNNAGMKPTKTGLWSSTQKRVEDRLEECFEYFSELMINLNLQDVWVEWPQYFSSAKGHTSAVRGDLLKLTAAASTVMCAGFVSCTKVYKLDVATWKGQLSKEHVNRRIKKAIGRSYSDHIADAVGMGLHLKQAKGFQ